MRTLAERTPVGRTVFDALSVSKPSSRRLRTAGIILLGSAVLHLAAIMILADQWAGPVSLRKPITFGLSVGLLLWTAGWVIDLLPSAPRLERRLGAAFAGSSLIEVGLITVQAWRGVPSHFNVMTTADLLVFTMMGVCVAVMSVCLVILTVWAFRRPPAPPTLRLAVRSGLVMVLTGLGVGEWMIEIGNDFVERNGDVPQQVVSGAAGSPTFVHFVSFHGIQLFLGAVLAAALLRVCAATAHRVVRLVVAGYWLLWFWSIVQAAAGRSPLDLSGPQTALALVGVALWTAAAVVLLAGWRRSRTSRMGSGSGLGSGSLPLTPVGGTTETLRPVKAPVGGTTGGMGSDATTGAAVPFRV